MDCLAATNFHVLFNEGLKLLGFERYLKSNKCYRDLEFSSTTFQRANQKAFEVVTYFLFDQLKGSEFTKAFRGCYPCLDKTHESDFRKNVITSFKKLEKDPNFNYKFLPGIVCNPGGDSFVSLYLALVNYILKKTLNVEKLNETPTEDLQAFIENERESLMNNCNKLKEKTLKDEEYCGYFSDKLATLKDDERCSKEQIKEIDDELMAKFGTTNTGELMSKLKANFDRINSHKLRTFYDQNEQVLSTESADIENRIVNMREFITDQSLLPIDLVEIRHSLENKLNKLKQNVDKDNSNIEDAIEKLDIKAVCYTSTNRILSDLTNELEKKIDLLKQQTEEKKRAFLERNEIQDLIKYVKSKVNFNPPVLEFKAEKNESKGKQSLPDLNFTAMDQTLANRSVDEEINLSINLAEMTCDYTPTDPDESYMLSNQTITRNPISQAPNLGNIKE